MGYPIWLAIQKNLTCCTKLCYSVQIMTQTLKASDVRSNWSQLLNKVFKEQTRVIVEKSGIPIAAVISAEDLWRLTRLEEERNERFKVIDRMRAAFKDIPDDEIERQIDKAVAQIRASKRSTAAW